MNEIINKILNLIFISVVAEGGDGNAMWFSKHTTIENLIPLIEKYNENNKTGWIIKEFVNYIIWGINQEWVTITNNESIFDARTNDIIITINY
jgi:hypothetical protein